MNNQELTHEEFFNECAQEVAECKALIAAMDERDISRMHTDMDLDERSIILTLLDTALEKGYTVTVVGMEYIIVKSANKKDIFAALYSTDSDVLTFHENGQYIGWIELIYGIGEDVISDYLDTVSINEIVDISLIKREVDNNLIYEYVGSSPMLPVDYKHYVYTGDTVSGEHSFDFPMED